MNFENNIILITNNKTVSETLKPRLILLRDIDNIVISNYDAAIENIQKSCPETILLHCDSDNIEGNATIELIKKIKSQFQTPILLVLKKYSQDFVLNAYDEGISDYISLDNGDAEILMRTIWCLKKNELSRAFNKHYDILKQLDVINSQTDFYSNKHSKAIYENEFADIAKTNAEAVFMCISPNDETKTKLGQKQLAQAIKHSVRNSDVVAHGAGNKIYILLLKTNLKGAFTVWERIKQNLGEEYTINAGITTVNDGTFAEHEKNVTNALCEAISTKVDLIIVTQNDEMDDNWLDKMNSSQKNFKLFKQAFNKKLEKVIAPAFFQMQKAYEEKLFDTTIEQYSNATLSVFSLKTNKLEGELRITYPGFSKINIDIVYKGLDSPENKRISLDLTEINETKLVKIMDDFIKEYKNQI